MKLRYIKYKYNSKCITCSTNVLRFDLSMKTGHCRNCRRKLFPKYLPQEQFDKYWELYKHEYK